MYPDIPAGSHPKARWVRCEVSGLPVFYVGYGRPPRLHETVRKEQARKRAAAAYAARRKGQPPKKRGRPRKSEALAAAAA